jgi:serine/threonine protein kinase
MISKNGVIKIGDFDSLISIRHAKKMNLPYEGNMRYQAPEIHDQQKTFGVETDIWSLGAMFKELLTLERFLIEKEEFSMFTDLK